MKPRRNGGVLRSLAACACALFAQWAGAAACMDAAPPCTEWIRMDGELGVMVYRSQALDAPNAAVKRAVVIVHGGSRDADNNFRHVLAAAFLAGALEDTVIVSPRFASNEEGQATGPNTVAAARAVPRDRLAPNELNWLSQFGGRHWNAGGEAVNAKVTSYAVIDEILRRLARREVFPNLGHVVVAGHSSGGQFVSRYQMVNRVHEALGTRVSYFVSNPGAYTYLDGRRPTSSAIPANVSSAVSGYIALGNAKLPAPYTAYPDARHCTTYDDWPYGLQKRVGYAAGSSDDALRKQAAQRPTAFVLGELDILPLVNFDISCNAVAQGASRLARGLAYSRYLREHYGAQHRVVVIDGCGHNTRCMLTAEAALPLLFPRD